MPQNEPIAVETAEEADLPELQQMHTRSIWQLGRDHYAEAVIESYIAEVGLLDTVLVTDRTYFLIRVDGRVAASGGWSLRRPGYARGPGAAALVPKIRSIFVDPAHARRGFGRRIMTHVEAQAAAGGHVRAELTATLMGIPFYAALGYRPGMPMVLDLAAGVKFVGLMMSKELTRARFHRAA